MTQQHQQHLLYHQQRQQYTSPQQSQQYMMMMAQHQQYMMMQQQQQQQQQHHQYLMQQQQHQQHIHLPYEQAVRFGGVDKGYRHGMMIPPEALLSMPRMPIHPPVFCSTTPVSVSMSPNRYGSSPSSSPFSPGFIGFTSPVPVPAFAVVPLPRSPPVTATQVWPLLPPPLPPPLLPPQFQFQAHAYGEVRTPAKLCHPLEAAMTSVSAHDVTALAYSMLSNDSPSASHLSVPDFRRGSPRVHDPRLSQLPHFSYSYHTHGAGVSPAAAGLANYGAASEDESEQHHDDSKARCQENEADHCVDNTDIDWVAVGDMIVPAGGGSAIRSPLLSRTTGVNGHRSDPRFPVRAKPSLISRDGGCVDPGWLLRVAELLQQDPTKCRDNKHSVSISDDVDFGFVAVQSGGVGNSETMFSVSSPSPSPSPSAVSSLSTSSTGAWHPFASSSSSACSSSDAYSDSSSGPASLAASSLVAGPSAATRLQSSDPIGDANPGTHNAGSSHNSDASISHTPSATSNNSNNSNRSVSTCRVVAGPLAFMPSFSQSGNGGACTSETCAPSPPATAQQQQQQRPHKWSSSHNVSTSVSKDDNMNGSDHGLTSRSTSSGGASVNSSRGVGGTGTTVPSRFYILTNSRHHAVLLRQIITLPYRAQFNMQIENESAVAVNGDPGTYSNGQLVIPAGGSVRVAVSCSASSEVGEAAQWCVFVWEYVISGGPDNLPRQQTRRLLQIGPHRSGAGQQEDEMTRQFIICRKTIAINIIPHHLKALSAEAPPFWPAVLRAIFDERCDAVYGEQPHLPPIPDPPTAALIAVNSKTIVGGISINDPTAVTAGEESREFDDDMKDQEVVEPGRSSEAVVVFSGDCRDENCGVSSLSHGGNNGTVRISLGWVSHPSWYALPGELLSLNLARILAGSQSPADHTLRHALGQHLEDRIKAAHSQSTSSSVLVSNSIPILPGIKPATLHSFHVHTAKQCALLHAEELQMEQDIRTYDLFYVTLKPVARNKKYRLNTNRPIPPAPAPAPPPAQLGTQAVQRQRMPAVQAHAQILVAVSASASTPKLPPPVIIPTSIGTAVNGAISYDRSGHRRSSDGAGASPAAPGAAVGFGILDSPTVALPGGNNRHVVSPGSGAAGSSASGGSSNGAIAGVDLEALSLYYITVPGVGERRPALSLGDCVFLRPDGTGTNGFGNPVTLHCYIHGVRETQIMLSIPLADYAAATNKTLKQVRAEQYHVRFAYSRVPFNFMYRALTTLGTYVTDQVKHHHDCSNNKDTLSVHRLLQCLFPTAAALAALAPLALPGSALESSSTSVSVAAASGSDTSTFSLPNLVPFDRNINAEQLRAVRHIVARSNGQAPYIIFGPPGTGKTVTVVEAVSQVLIHDLSARVLMVCPSDYAADIIVLRLKDRFSTKQMIRINSSQRYTTVDVSIIKYCVHDPATDLYCMPSLDTLLEYRLVVCTCIMAGHLSSMGTPVGHFSHILFDESSQALEPESLVPLCLMGNRTSIILAGDHQQLGPVVHSKFATQHGLEVSLLERLMSRSMYRPRGAHARHGSNGTTFSDGDPRCMTTLVRNYRSHPALLSVPSRLFYDNKLQAYADPTVTHSLTSWKELPNQRGAITATATADSSSLAVPTAGSGIGGFPLMFYGVVGMDVYESDSSSFYNPLEASKLTELIERLLMAGRDGNANSGSSTNRDSKGSSNPSGNSGDGVNSDRPVLSVGTQDIGVIAPYRKQVLKLRHLLRSRALGAIRVGSVDDYQGQEEKCVFISTVLSRHRGKRSPSRSSSSFSSALSALSHTAARVEQQVGLLGNRRRFNVAITRAKALTVIVGNPMVLAGDVYWRTLLQYCVDNNAYCGCPCPLSPSYAHVPTLAPTPTPVPGPVLAPATKNDRQTEEVPASAPSSHRRSDEHEVTIEDDGKDDCSNAAYDDLIGAMAIPPSSPAMCAPNDDAEMSRFVSRAYELAAASGLSLTLGTGNARSQYPDADDLETAYADELQWRVMI